MRDRDGRCRRLSVPQRERVRAVSIDEKVDCAEDKSRVRVDRHRRPDRRGNAALQDCYDLHPLAVEDAIIADQLPKVDVYDDQLFVVARTARLEGETSTMARPRSSSATATSSPSAMAPTRAHTALREQLEKAPTLLMHGVDYRAPRRARLHRRRLCAAGRGHRGGSAGDGDPGVDSFLDRDESTTSSRCAAS